METSPETWRRCSACKNGIPFGADHFTCNVSTCNRPRTGLVFCSVSCWETHVPVMNHRESWAVERKAPTREAWLREQSAAAGGVAPAKPAAPVPAPTRTPGVMAALPPSRPAESRPPARAAAEGGREVLVVASKLKAYVRAISGMNTSDGVLEPLSDWLRGLASEAVRSAERDGRRTVLERDIPRRSRS